MAGIGLYDTTLSLGSATIQTEMFRHTGFKTVVYTQRITHIALRCPDDHACDTVSAGGTWSVWVDGLDAHNQKIYALVGALKNPLTGTPIAVFSVRDPSIASISPIGIRASTVTALRPGATWIMATRDSLLDSLRLIVR
ncbi:MAG TPA: hypothetical protein VGQ30_12280 [Gemmatimonadaceae bacterium]|nr:hypothetical protein [Gemmatimonadaceae bacterium]